MEETKFLIVIGLDIEGYTNKPIIQQLKVQKKLEDWVLKASEEAKLSDSGVAPKWIDTGDGGFLIYETDYLKSLTFFEIFYRELDRHNDDVKDEAKILVRAAVHCDDALHWQGKLGVRYAGNAINVCARILNGMLRSYSNQVVCSGIYMEKIMQGGVAVKGRRMQDYVDKHGVGHDVWNMQKVPGFGVELETDHLHEEPHEWRFES